jgi:hypothetical protein
LDPCEQALVVVKVLAARDFESAVVLHGFKADAAVVPVCLECSGMIRYELAAPLFGRGSNVRHIL